MKVLVSFLLSFLFLGLCVALEASDPNSKDCRYDKGSWQDCQNGIQKRVLKLKSSNSPSANCSLERTVERPCKKQCKYSKGTWSECVNGSKERVDKLRSQVSSAECKPEKITNKPCKKQCSYDKPEWSSCENGYKTKKLTLLENPDNSADCEPVRNITKACSGNKLKLRKNARKRNRNME